MRRLFRLGIVRGLVVALAGLGIVGAIAVLVAGSGFYNVAASRGHWVAVEWFLHFAMRNSVERRATALEPPPDLDSPDRIRLGAAHFHSGCAYCHGAPTIAISPVAQHMLPPPPDLRAAATEWDERELFWIVRHGIKYTGMPAWISQQRNDEVWAVVAFLRRLPSLDPESYRELALGPVRPRPPGGRELATTGGTVDAVAACGRCHGADDRGPISGLVPVLHGQPAEFLAAALRDYAQGRRESGIMQPVARDLTAPEIDQVASYYAGLSPLAGSGSQPDGAASLERGRVLAADGSPADRLPACLTCHGGRGLPAYPRLVGQPAPYLVEQLRLFRAASTRHTQTGAIMAPIARRLSDQQIVDVAGYFASLGAESAAAGTARR
jgi:cytochrome c553